MRTFRRFVRRVARPFAMVGIVGAVSTSMLIAGPMESAHALVKYRDAKAAETFIMGAAKTIAPAAQVAMAAGTFTPVGFGVRVLQLGFLAYSTSDIWMPIVAGTFGQAPPGNTPDAKASTDPKFTLVDVSVAPPASKGERLSITVNNAYPDVRNITVAYFIKCKNGTTVTDVKSSISGGWSPGSTTTFAQCPTGSTVGGAVVGPENGAPELAVPTTGIGPVTVLRIGELAGSGQPGFDPYGQDTKYKVRSECIDSNGVFSTVEAESSGDYLRFPSCEAAGKGHGTGKTSIVGLAPGTTVEQPVWDSPRAPSDPSTPLCDASRPTGGCTLSVELDGQPCTSGSVECQNWSEVNKNDPNAGTRLKCKFGPYTLTMSQCGLLERAYEPGGAAATEPNTDGNPDTRSKPDPANPLAPAAPPAPSISPVPGGSGQPAPDADEKQKQCFPTGWAALNPVEWVMKPVGCALEAAFVPKTQTVQTQSTRIQEKVKTVGFGSVTTAWMDTFDAVGGGSGCAGPTVNFNFGSTGQSLQPFNACSQPMSTVAGITYAFSSIVIVLAGGLGIARAIGSGFGFNFTLGRGSSE